MLTSCRILKLILLGMIELWFPSDLYCMEVVFKIRIKNIQLVNNLKVNSKQGQLEVCRKESFLWSKYSRQKVRGHSISVLSSRSCTWDDCGHHQKRLILTFPVSHLGCQEVWLAVVVDQKAGCEMFLTRRERVVGGDGRWKSEGWDLDNVCRARCRCLALISYPVAGLEGQSGPSWLLSAGATLRHVQISWQRFSKNLLKTNIYCKLLL